MKWKRGRPRLPMALALAAIVGSLLGVGLPASAFSGTLTGSTTMGGGTEYYGTFRQHYSSTTVTLRMDSTTNMCGGNLGAGIWDGYSHSTSDRTAIRYWGVGGGSPLGTQFTLQWPTSTGWTTTIPTDTYAMYDAASGEPSCATLLSWTGYLVL